MSQRHILGVLGKNERRHLRSSWSLLNLAGSPRICAWCKPKRSPFSQFSEVRATPRNTSFFAHTHNRCFRYEVYGSTISMPKEDSWRFAFVLFRRFPTLSTAGMFDFSEKDPPKQYPVSGHHPLVGEFKIRFPFFSYELPGPSSCIGMNPGSRIVMADQGEVAHVAVKWDIS